MSNVRAINGPHLRTERTTRQVMMYVTLSLIPALLGAVYFLDFAPFTWQAFLLQSV